MKHLETKREAAERHRVASMSKGIARFLERTSREIDVPDESLVPVVEGPGQGQQSGVKDNPSDIEYRDGPEPALGSCRTSAPVKELIFDKIRKTLDDAAEILRESLELTVGGVVFLDTALGYTEIDNTDAYMDMSTDLGVQVLRDDRAGKQRQKSNQDTLRPILTSDDDLGRCLSQGCIRSSTDKHKPTKTLAASAAQIASWDPQSRVLDEKTLQLLLHSYPKGNVWYIDDEGYFPSLEQINELEQAVAKSPSGGRRSILPHDVTKQRAEATLLSRVFHKARQIVFLPLWDAGGGMRSISKVISC
jgi:hypothetical protein